jgi:hypothetical protein
MSRSFLGLLALPLLLAAPATAFACECAQTAGFVKTAKSSPHVVVVQATGARDGALQFDVVRVLKGGAVGESITIAPGIGKSCNEPAGRFTSGQRYVLALPKVFEGQPLGTCKKRVADAAGGELQLKNGEKKTLDELQKSLNKVK